MIEFSPTFRFPSPRLQRLAAVGTLVLLFALLLLGAVVTSFRVGMADPVWPTRPWHLLTISWEEPSAGYLIEHTHRLAGFVTGGAVSLLAMLLWLTEPRPIVRWGGLVAIIALLAAFGQLHGSLLGHQRILRETGELTAPNWSTTVGSTLAVLAVTAVFALVSGGVRLLGVALLVGVMAQGILGGMRVYLNALYGSDLATIHGVFSQVVLALAVTVVVMTRPRRAPPVVDRGLKTWALAAAVIVFAQIVFGALLRHTDSPLGPRLHLLNAFLVVFATAAVSRRSRGTSVRGLAIIASSLAGVQVLLGVEAWMIRFKAGFLQSPIQQITQGEAVVRTLHTVVGYGLFATVMAIAVVLLRNREPAVRRQVVAQPAAPAEVAV
jgi:cytochrome c oxidase assembly protein subunit 15